MSLTAEQLWIEDIRRGNPSAWSRLIETYEGRLLAFCESRIGRRGTSEDVVQETFIGFLTSLPNYDRSRPLESYLFSICAHKLTDHLRREGRRPAIPFSGIANEGRASPQFPAQERAPSTIMRSEERKDLEDRALGSSLREMVGKWLEKGEWTKVKCLELLFVRGTANKEVARRLGLSEQQVANYKSDTLIQLKKSLRGSGLNTDVFPELE